MADDTCLWCGAPATHYCDSLIGCERRASDKTLITGEGFTCDAPMCEAHRKQVGHVAMSEGPHDTMDVCPAHADVGLHPKSPWSLAVGAKASWRVRAEVRAAAARERRAKMGVVRGGAVR